MVCTTMPAIAVEAPIIGVRHSILAPASATDFDVHILFGAELLGKLDKIWDVDSLWCYRLPSSIHNLDTRLQMHSIAHDFTR